MDKQKEKDTIQLQTLEKENRLNLNAMNEVFKDLQLKNYQQQKEINALKDNMKTLNDNLAQVLQRVNVVVAKSMGNGPTG